MNLYIVTTENIKDGTARLETSSVYETKRQAIEAAEKLPPPVRGFCRVLYVCRQDELLAETPF